LSQLPTLLRYNAGNWERLERPVITETPVSLTVNGQEWLTLMCTPLDLEALAVGFLFNEASSTRRRKFHCCRFAPPKPMWTFG